MSGFCFVIRTLVKNVREELSKNIFRTFLFYVMRTFDSNVQGTLLCQVFLSLSVPNMIKLKDVGLEHFSPHGKSAGSKCVPETAPWP